MATSARNQSLELVHLPTEVLVDIFKHVPDKDLSTVRLVCKKLCDAATPRFATVYFTERIHAVSPYSIETLVEITEHPVFGRYVKTVTICAARRSNITEASCPDIFYEEIGRNKRLNGFVGRGRFVCLMRRVFGNIRSLSGSVNIRIYDNSGRGYLDGKLPLGENYLERTTWLGYTQLTKHSVVDRMVRVSEQTMCAAREAGCPIERLGVDLFYTEEESNTVVYQVLGSSIRPLRVCLGGENSCRLSYDSKSRYLELKGIYFQPSLPMRPTQTWLLTKGVIRLKLTLIDTYDLVRVRPFFSPHLTSLKIHKMSVQTSSFDQNLWSEPIQMISDLPGLQYCRLSCLTYINLHT